MRLISVSAMSSGGCRPARIASVMSGGEEGQRQELADVAVTDAFFSGDVREGSYPALLQIIEPGMRLHHAADEALVGICRCLSPVGSIEHQPHLHAASADAGRDAVGNCRVGLSCHP